MSFGSDKIAEIIYNDTGILALIDTFESKPSIWFDLIVPESFELTSGKSYINFYRATPVVGALEWGDFSYTINCRAENNINANTLQDAVFSAFNRKNTTTDRGLFICTVLPTIPPKDDRDDYNALLEVQLKTN